MLSRHILRSKTLQSVYSYIVGGETDLSRGRRALLDSVEDMRDLIYLQLSAFLEIRDLAERKMEENRNKHIPTADDINPNPRFIQNPFMAHLRDNEHVKTGIAAARANWSDMNELFRKIYSEIISWPEYIKYMADSDDSFEHHQHFAVKLFKKFVAFDNDLRALFGERNLHWGDDSVLTGLMVHAWLKAYDPNDESTLRFPSLFKSADHIGDDDDKAFMVSLFETTVLQYNRFDEVIATHIRNWDPERVNTLDMMIIKLAITEMSLFQNIPLKASMNEYIELSKEYGTPKSNSFVNGVLDKVINDLVSQGVIRKTGKGLV